MTPVHHAELGDNLRHKPMVEFAAEPSDLRAGVREGVAGPSLLTELGYPDEQINALFEAGVLFSADIAS